MTKLAKIVFCLFATQLVFLPSFLAYLFVMYNLFGIRFHINCFIPDSNEVCVFVYKD